MKFKDYVYVRPNLETYIEKMEQELAQIATGKDLETEREAIHNVFKLVDEMSSMAVLASIRNSLDTKDPFYEAEQAFFDENQPIMQQYYHQFDQKLLSSAHRNVFEKELGSLLFESSELNQKTFSPEIIPDLQKENRLSTQYSKLLASAEIEFKDQVYNLSQMSPFLQDKDRETRHQAQLVVSKYFSENEAELDQIYDELVQVRHQIAKTLGYENFVQLGYDRFGRLDYNHKDVKTYRDQIYQDVVPLVTELTRRKAARLGIEDPKSYDLALSFLSGNPSPKGDREWMVNHAKTMYREMNPVTHEFFEFMSSKDLLDLDSKPGKQGGGYCTYIPTYESPFIFANFNGTSHDVEVLTHEAGHALQVYLSRHLLHSYRWPTMEAAEIHSMSMEFLAWPWMSLFFEEDTDKFKFSHLAGAISFLPYGVLVDEFQHEIYQHPELTPDERKATWRRIEKKYMPFKDYGDDEFMEKGTYWFRQGHIFAAPFYYIDYTLAQVCAFQYWVMSQEDHEKAMESYLALCRLGGSKTFVSLLESAQLENPFHDGVVKKIIDPIKAYLDSIDDMKL